MIATERKSIDDVFSSCKAEGRAALIPFICCGYKTRNDTVDILLSMQEGGADIIELGVPFSDPTADGPTIQKCHHIGVLQGITLQDVLSTIKEAREKGLYIPVVIMGYLNNLLAYGLRNICCDGKAAGLDGFIVVDLPVEAGDELLQYIDEFNLSFIPLITPTTSEKRMSPIAKSARGYIYCVSVTGVTGTRTELPQDLDHFLGRIRQYTSLPLGLGFGLCTREHVIAVSKVADAAIVGSQIVKVIDDAPDTTQGRAQHVKEYIKYMRGI